MKVAFIRNETRRERLLADSFRIGLLRHCDSFQLITKDNLEETNADVVAFVGLKGHRIHETLTRRGKHFIYLDKGYFYPEENYASKVAKQVKIVQCWRLSVDETQPLEYLTNARHSIKRWDKIGPRPKPWREPTTNGHIILAGSSEKYHLFNRLPHPTAYFEKVVSELRQYTDRPIRYRPKPSWTEATPIAGTEFAPYHSFETHLEGAHAVITHGSNASLIGMLMGVPSIILGNGIMQPISSTNLAEIECPYLATEEDRLQLLANLAHSQYTLNEFASGTAWHSVKTLFLQ